MGPLFLVGLGDAAPASAPASYLTAAGAVAAVLAAPASRALNVAIGSVFNRPGTKAANRVEVTIRFISGPVNPWP